MERERKNWKRITIKYTLLFLVCGSIICTFFFLRRSSLIGNDDSFNQLYPVFIYTGKYIRNLLHGVVQQFDFRIGLGDDVISALNWHGFGDLTQVISALVPLKYSEPAYAFTMILKYYLCGITFFVYAWRYLREENSLLAGALLYAFSVFAFFRGLQFWIFLNSMITFPLFLYGVDQIRENRKHISGVFLTALFCQGMNGFYFFYMEIVLTALYFPLVALTDNTLAFRARWRKLWRDGIAVAIHVILGAGLGAVILFPSILGYLNSSRTGRTKIFKSIADALFYDKEFYLSNIKCLIVPGIWESIVTVPIVVLLGIVLIFIGEKGGRQFKILSMVTLILFGIPLVGSIMNGLSYSTDRWYFAVLLFLILLTLTEMERIRQLNRRQIAIFLVVSESLILINLVLSGLEKGIIFRSAVLSAFVLALPVAWNHKRRKNYLLALVCLMTVFNGLMVFGHRAIGGLGYSWGFIPENMALERMMESVEGLDPERQDEFERLDIYSSSLATALVMDYYGTSEYFSMPNAYVSEFYRTLFISPGVRSATHILKGLDGREELLALLSVGEYMDFYMEDGRAVPYIKRNETFLPLGFTYKEWVNREIFDTLNPLEKESLMLKAVVLENPQTNIQEMQAEDFRLEEEIDYTLEYVDIQPEGTVFTTRPGSRIRITLEPSDTDAVYVRFRDFVVLEEGVHEMYVGNKSLQLRSREDIYYMGDDEFWVYVTELKEKNEKQYFDILFDEESSFSLKEIMVYNHRPDIISVEERSRNVLDNLETKTNTVMGTINLEQDEWLFLSIPYSKGWKAYVDGKEAEILKANVAFMALDIPGGRHSVELVYETPGLRAGLIISVGSTVFLIMLVMVEKRRRYKDKTV